MQMSLMDVLITTVVSMGIVFIILTILMFLMEGSSYLIRKLEHKIVASSEEKTQSEEKRDGAHGTSELEQVAMLVALTQASKNQSGKHYEVVSIEKKVS